MHVHEDAYPVQWAGRQAVVALPEHIGVSNAGQIREELLWVINRGAAELIADMTVTGSCDHAGADALVRAYRRAVISGTELRLVVAAQVVRRVLAVSGLDRLVSMYPSLEAATAARTPAAVLRRPASAHANGHAPPDGATRASREHQAARAADGPGAANTPAVVRQLADALDGGVALAGSDGTLELASRRLEEMSGYEPAEPPGQPVESLIPADLQETHRGHRAAYAQTPRALPMGAGAPLVRLRKDGATFPVEVSLSPPPAAAGRLTVAVIRDVTEARRREDLAVIAREAATEQPHQGQELLDRITASLFQVGLGLQTATSPPAGPASQAVTQALRRLDDMIREMRDTVFTTRGQRPCSPAETRSWPPGRAVTREESDEQAGEHGPAIAQLEPGRGREGSDPGRAAGRAAVVGNAAPAIPHT